MSDIVKDGKKIIVMPGRDLIASMADEFREEINSLLQESPKEIQIDLSGVKMIDSSGISIITTTHNALKKSGGILRIINATSDIANLFSVMNLDRHFKVEEAEQKHNMH